MRLLLSFSALSLLATQVTLPPEPDPTRASGAGLARAGTTWVFVDQACSPADTVGSPIDQDPGSVWCFEGAGGDSTWPGNVFGGEWSHWALADPPEFPASPWHVTANVGGPSTGTFNARLGCDSTSFSVGSCEEAAYWPAGAEGYGNDWNWALELDAGGQDASGGGTIEFDLRYDTECNYDYLYLEYFDSGSSEWVAVTDTSGAAAVFNGVSGNPDLHNGGTGRECGGDLLGSSDEFDPGTGNILFHGNSQWITNVTFPLPAQGGGMRLRWRGETDRAWSDEDALGDTDGLAAIDNVLVTFSATGATISDDFESGDFAGLVTSSGPPAAWTLPPLIGSPYDGWHLEFDPNYTNKGNTISFSDDWMWAAKPPSGPIPVNEFDFLLVTPEFDVQGWLGGVIEYARYVCLPTENEDWLVPMVRTYDASVAGSWSSWQELAPPLSGGCLEWEMNVQHDVTPFLGTTVDSLQVGWRVLDASRPGDPSWGAHAQSQVLIDNVSLGEFDNPFPLDPTGWEFGQLDWYDRSNTLILENSSWGQFAADFVALPNAGLYLNVIADAGSGTAWIVQNYPIFDDPTGQADPRQGGDFDINDLGISEGGDLPSMNFGYTIDTQVRVTAPSVPLTPITVSPIRRFAWMGDVSGNIDPADIGAPAGHKQKAPYKNRISHPTMRSMQEDSLHCLVGATGRSIDWLTRLYDLADTTVWTKQAIKESLEAYRTDSEFNNANFLDAKAVLLQKIVGPNRIAKTKVMDLANHIPSRPNLIEVPQLNPIEWIRSEMKTEDVEMVFGDISHPDTTKRWLHIVTLTDIAEQNDSTVIGYRDDETQGDDSTGDTFLKKAFLLRSGGKWRFRIRPDLATTTSWEITSIISESVCEKAVESGGSVTWGADSTQIPIQSTIPPGATVTFHWTSGPITRPAGRAQQHGRYQEYTETNSSGSRVTRKYYPPNDPTITDYYERLVVPGGGDPEVHTALLRRFGRSFASEWTFRPIQEVPPVDYRIPQLVSATGAGADVHCAVDLEKFLVSNPEAFAAGAWDDDDLLSSLGVTIVNGQVPGIEGIWWSTTPFEFDETSDTGWVPEGGTYLDSATYGDDLRIAGTLGTSPPPNASDSPVVAADGWLRVQPNPFGDRTDLVFSITNGGPVDLRVFDVRGRLVRVLTKGRLEAGIHTVPWDGRTGGGATAPAGIYFYRLKTPESVRSGKLVLVRQSAR